MTKIHFTGKASDFLKIGVAAAARGDIESVREILKEKRQWITRVGSHGRTMLWEAAHRGKLEMVKYLVKRGSDIDACGTHYTPYFVEISCYCIARHKKHHDVADFLLEKGAKIDIHTLAFLGDCEHVKKILNKNPGSLNEGHPQYVMGDLANQGLDYHLAPAAWATPLCYALRGGDVETVKYLIENGAKIKRNEEALFIAAKDGVGKVRLLLENGADPGKTPSVNPDQGELYELVSAYGARSPDAAKNSKELVYLCRGDRGGKPAQVKRLLDLGADVNFQDHKGKTALHRAARAGFLETITILLDQGASVEIEDLNRETPLFDVVRSTIKNLENRKAALRLLLKAGADPLHANHKAETPSSVAEGLKRTYAKELANVLQCQNR